MKISIFARFFRPKNEKTILDWMHGIVSFRLRTAGKEHVLVAS